MHKQTVYIFIAAIALICCLSAAANYYPQVIQKEQINAGLESLVLGNLPEYTLTEKAAFLNIASKRFTEAQTGSVPVLQTLAKMYNEVSKAELYWIEGSLLRDEAFGMISNGDLQSAQANFKEARKSYLAMQLHVSNIRTDLDYASLKPYYTLNKADVSAVKGGLENQAHESVQFCNAMNTTLNGLQTNNTVQVQQGIGSLKELVGSTSYDSMAVGVISYFENP